MEAIEVYRVYWGADTSDEFRGVVYSDGTVLGDDAEFFLDRIHRVIGPIQEHEFESHWENITAYFLKSFNNGYYASVVVEVNE